MLHGAFAHLNPVHVPAAVPQRHARFVEELRVEAQRRREQFVEHSKVTYDEFLDLPIWAAAETMTCGAIFTLFAMSGNGIQKRVARRYGLGGPARYSWLQTRNYIRSKCAHQARLWNRELAIKPLIPYASNSPDWHNPQTVANNRAFVVLTLLNCMLCQIAPQSAWRTRLDSLFDRFPDIPLASMRIAPNWRDHVLWK